MRLQARAGLMVHLVGLLTEAGMPFAVRGGNEIDVQDAERWAANVDPELVEEINRTLRPSSPRLQTSIVAAVPPGGSGAPSTPDVSHTHAGGAEVAIPPITRPPASGPGSAWDAQAEYAGYLGLDVQGKSRDDIVAMITEAETQ